MVRISFVEFLCIVAIGVAMIEIPGHGFSRSPGPSVAAGPVEARVVAARPEVYVHTSPQENHR